MLQSLLMQREHPYGFEVFKGNHAEVYYAVYYVLTSFAKYALPCITGMEFLFLFLIEEHSKVQGSHFVINVSGSPAGYSHCFCKAVDLRYTGILKTHTLLFRVTHLYSLG